MVAVVTLWTLAWYTVTQQTYAFGEVSRSRVSDPMRHSQTGTMEQEVDRKLTVLTIRAITHAANFYHRSLIVHCVAVVLFTLHIIVSECSHFLDRLKKKKVELTNLILNYIVQSCTDVYSANTDTWIDRLNSSCYNFCNASCKVDPSHFT